MNLQYISDSHGKTKGVFIPIDDWETLKNKYKGLEEEEYTEPTEQEILDGIKDALRQVKLHQEGKIKLKPAREKDKVKKRLKELIKEGYITWGGGKPTGLKNAPIIKGKSISDIVIEDRR